MNINKPTFTKDWFSANIPTWSRVLIPQFKDVETHAIEIGSFEGRSALWLCENVLTHKDSTLDCVDNWTGGVVDTGFIESVDWKGARKLFYKNIEEFKNKINIVEKDSARYLKDREKLADLIYIDAGHLASNALVDGVLSHLVLKQGGYIIFDDYLWTGIESNPTTPKPAIDSFMNCFSPQYYLISMGYQVILKKK